MIVLNNYKRFCIYIYDLYLLLSNEIDEDSDVEKNPNPPSEPRESKRDRNHRHHSSDG